MKRILLVDDSIDTLNLAKKFLVDAGYLVITSKEAFTGFEQIKKNVFDLIITDINMPHKNGFDFVDGLRKHKALNRVPVIFMSARSSDKDILRGIGVGGDDYIIKPFSKEGLLDRVDRLIGKRPENHREVTLEPEDARAEMVVSLQIQIKTISELGLIVESNHPIRDGVSLTILSSLLQKIGIPERAFEVIHCRDRGNTYEIGIRFKGLNDSCLNRLLDWIQIKKKSEKQSA